MSEAIVVVLTGLADEGVEQRDELATEANAMRVAIFCRPNRRALFESVDAEPAGTVRADLETRGKLIGPYDILIAGHALRHHMTLVTANLSVRASERACVARLGEKLSCEVGRLAKWITVQAAFRASDGAFSAREAAACTVVGYSSRGG